jgi:hypothetical protein
MYEFMMLGVFIERDPVRMDSPKAFVEASRRTGKKMQGCMQQLDREHVLLLFRSSTNAFQADKWKENAGMYAATRQGTCPFAFSVLHQCFSG